VEDGTAMDRYLAAHQADLVILDLMLPGEDGLSIGRRLRQQHDLPIIILSARGEELDRIVGLEMGADDYLTKPFNPRELLARIRSVLRRCSRSAIASPRTNDHFRFGPYELDVDRHRLKRGDEKGYDHSPLDRSIDVCVGRLRRKIEPDPSKPVYLKTVRGAGYLFCSDD